MPTATFAQTQNQRAVGNMYTTALNMIEDYRIQDIAGQFSIEKMYIDHGQVFIIMTGDGGPLAMIYDPIAHKISLEESPNKSETSF
jgi:hypothetical protein